METDRSPAVLLEDLVAFYKALSDRTRLRIVGLVAERPRYVQELAEALGVSAPTVSHHLFRLRSAGLVAAGRQGAQVYYRLETDRIERLSRALLGVKASPPRDERERVLRAYFDGDRLIRLPRNRRKRLIVLEEVARRFEHGRRYPEREVNAILRGLYTDHSTLRRDLIDYRFMTRDRGIYQLLPARASA